MVVTEMGGWVETPLITEDFCRADCPEEEGVHEKRKPVEGKPVEGKPVEELP